MRLFRRGNRNKSIHGSVVLKSPPQNGVGVPYHGAYSWHELPGAGANQYSWDRLALPTYSPAGNGIPNGANDPAEPQEVIVNAGQIVHSPSAAPVGNAIQGAILYVLGDPGTPSGQFILQPLTNTSPASAAFMHNDMMGEIPIGALD